MRELWVRNGCPSCSNEHNVSEDAITDPSRIVEKNNFTVFMDIFYGGLRHELYLVNT